MNDKYAFNPVMSKPEQRQIKGKLEVRAKRPTRMGNSETHVPEGHVGYVLHAGLNQSGPVVFWPSMPKEHKGDWRTSVHDRDDLEPTGKRG